MYSFNFKRLCSYFPLQLITDWCIKPGSDDPLSIISYCLCGRCVLRVLFSRSFCDNEMHSVTVFRAQLGVTILIESSFSMNCHKVRYKPLVCFCHLFYRHFFNPKRNIQNYVLLLPIVQSPVLLIQNEMKLSLTEMFSWTVWYNNMLHGRKRSWDTEKRTVLPKLWRKKVVTAWNCFKSGEVP